MLVLKGGDGGPSPLAGRDFPALCATSRENRGQASVYPAAAAPPTAVTHLTITSLKVNWLLFQRDDHAN